MTPKNLSYFRPISLILIAAGMVLSSLQAEEPRMDTEAQLEQLKANMQAMQEMMQSMQQQITHLEAERDRQEAELAELKEREASSRSLIEENSESYQALSRIAEGELPDKLSQVQYRGSFKDTQTAASRPVDYTLEPEYRGFIPVPNTPVLMKFNFKPRIDASVDSGNTGTPERFIPARFPLKDSPEYSDSVHSHITANGTQIQVDVRAPSVPGEFRLFYQNDFYDEQDANMKPRIQHLYGQYHGFTFGYTYSVWEDPDVWPDTVDYEGPNSVIFARRPVVQYTHTLSDQWNATVGIEQADFYVDESSQPGSDDSGDEWTRLPDIGANLRWESLERGHIQASTMVREIAVRDADGDEHEDYGWGVNLAANINLTDSDSVQFLGVYGEGVGGMGNDTSFLDSDGAFDLNGDFEALPYWSVMFGWTHHWNESFRSTFTYGHVELDPTDAQAETFYESSDYASGNLIWQITPRWGAGAELLYGQLEAQNGESSDDLYRLQFGMFYSIF
ncbi:MAG: DcaP family trimeric outer membrane transporter [Coraliomargarita sp.]